MAHAETATLADGCFWGMEEYFRKFAGITATKVGYAGVDVAKASYAAVSSGETGLAEVVQIDFDPAKVSYLGLKPKRRCWV